MTDKYWQERVQRFLEVPTPAVGVDWVMQVPQLPAGIWWRPKSIVWKLQTSAVVANRRTRLLYAATPLGSAGFPASLDLAYMFTQPSANQAASSLLSYCASESGELNSTFSSVMTLPFDLRLAPGHFIGVSTENLDVADQFSGIRLLVQELTYLPSDYAKG
jgi:hypothetical protein